MAVAAVAAASLVLFRASAVRISNNDPSPRFNKLSFESVVLSEPEGFSPEEEEEESEPVVVVEITTVDSSAERSEETWMRLLKRLVSSLPTAGKTAALRTAQTSCSKASRMHRNSVLLALTTAALSLSLAAFTAGESPL